MERKIIKLDLKMKVKLLEIVNSGQITPEQADTLLPQIDARGKTFSVSEIYNNTDEHD